MDIGNLSILARAQCRKIIAEPKELIRIVKGKDMPEEEVDNYVRLALHARGFGIEI